MKTLRAIAWFNVFVVGVFGLGLVAALNGGVWSTILPVWIGAWALVGLLSSP